MHHPGAIAAPTSVPGARIGATFASLPLELVDLIVAHAIANEDLPIRRERHLHNYCLVHPAFVPAAQRRLFRAPYVATQAAARSLARLLQGNRRLASYVTGVSVVGEYTSEAGVMNELRGAFGACRRLAAVELRDVGFNTALHLPLLAQLKRLTLTSVTLTLPSIGCTFPHLTMLNLSNVALMHTSTSPAFPALISLTYNNTLPSPFTFTASPLFFASSTITSTGAHLKHLTLSRLFSPTHYLLSRKSPSLAAGPLPPPHTRSLIAEIEPTLEAFDALESLTLLADSSHQAGAYFALLDSLPRAPSWQLKRFEVRVEMGFRDQVQEVEGMAEEIVDKFFEGEGRDGCSNSVDDAESWRRGGLEAGGAGEVEVVSAKSNGKRRLEKLVLPREFWMLSQVEAVRELRRIAEDAGVVVEFSS